MWIEKTLWWAATTCSILVILGAVGGRTERLYGQPGEEGYTIATEGGTRWALWAVGWGSATVVALAAGRGWGRQRRWLAAASTAGAAVAFVLAAERAGRHWAALLEERGRPRTYVLDIAPGLPIAAVAAALGTGFALVLALGWLGPGDREGSPLPSAADLPASRPSSEAR